MDTAQSVPDGWSWCVCMRFFRNQTFILPGTDSPRPIDYCVSDNRVESTPSTSNKRVRDFNFLKLYLFVFHNTDTFDPLPY
jgi:hypothetical protein